MAAVATGIAAPATLAAQEQDGGDVRVFRREGGPEGEVSLVVTTPPAVVGAALPSSAFTVRQGDADVPAEVTPVPAEGIEAALDEFSDDATRKVALLMTDDDGDVSPALAGRLVEEGVSLYYVQAAVQ